MVLLRPTILRHDGGLAASPPLRYIVKRERGRLSPFPSSFPSRCAPSTRAIPCPVVSRDIFVQDIPTAARSVSDIPDDWRPRPLSFDAADIIGAVRELAPSADFTDPTWDMSSCRGSTSRSTLPALDSPRASRSTCGLPTARSRPVHCPAARRAGVRAFDPKARRTRASSGMAERSPVVFRPIGCVEAEAVDERRGRGRNVPGCASFADRRRRRAVAPSPQGSRTSGGADQDHWPSDGDPGLLWCARQGSNLRPWD